MKYIHGDTCHTDAVKASRSLAAWRHSSSDGVSPGLGDSKLKARNATVESILMVIPHPRTEKACKNHVSNI